MREGKKKKLLKVHVAVNFINYIYIYSARPISKVPYPTGAKGKL